ncbi:MAG: hypothetical protein R3Y50_03315 [Rikenellaceae bacterium]
MKNFSQKFFSSVFALTALLAGAVDAQATNIVPKTEGIRRVVTAQINGEEMLYISEIDGAVSLNQFNGKSRWRIPSDNPALMFEIIATDIDGDKSDDLLGVSANGSVYAWSSGGKLLWKFSTPEKVRLCQIATVGEGSDMRIFAGGNDYNLYELDIKGNLLSTTAVEGSVLYIESGDFITKGKDDLFVFTLTHDKLHSNFFGFIDSDTKEIIKSGAIGDIYKEVIEVSEERLTPATSLIVNKVSVSDINGDGKDDVILTGHSSTGSTYVFDGDLNPIINCFGSKKDGQVYAHAVATSLQPVKEQIAMQYGGIMRVFDLKGNLLATVGERYKGVIFNELVLAPDHKTLIGAGQIGGDNTLYCFDLTKDKWWEEPQELGGRAAEVEDNIATLYAQALKFKRPDYQQKQQNSFTLLGVNPSSIAPEVMKLSEGEIITLSGGGNFSENTSRDHMVAAFGESALKHDRRRKYNNTREEIVEWARQKEAANDPFEMWVGHGTDPFFVQIETIEQMLKVAPNTCRGLVYAEMAGASDPRVVYFVNEYMPRIAKAVRDNNSKTKLYFRYKNMFWAADCHEPIWKEMFFSGKYNDILAPAAEDTNNRLQDLNFAGRVGMWMSGYVDDYAIRLINDNPTSWRPYSPGGQRSFSPYLRNAALMIAYGSRYGVFGLAYLNDLSYNPLLALVKSGILPTVKPEDILSVGSWHLVKDIDQEYLERVNNGHNLLKYDVTDTDAIVSVAGVHWCGADIPEYDYSKIASGVNYRWLNFIPPMPNGMVPFTASEYAKQLDKDKVGYVVSDIHHAIVDGKKVEAKEFGSTMKNIVENGGKSLLMRVDNASWGLFKVGDNHARLILIDPGYIDPAERIATINLQNTMPKGAVDILTGEKLSVKGGKMEITVPAGSMRFIDFEYEEASAFDK